VNGRNQFKSQEALSFAFQLNREGACVGDEVEQPRAAGANQTFCDGSRVPTASRHWTSITHRVQDLKIIIYKPSSPLKKTNTNAVLRVSFRATAHRRKTSVFEMLKNQNPARSCKAKQTIISSLPTSLHTIPF
jgi:hypothetical protein